MNQYPEISDILHNYFWEQLKLYFVIGGLPEAVDTFAKEKKYTLILEKRSVVFSDVAVDVTDEIIKRFDKEKGKK